MRVALLTLVLIQSCLVAPAARAAAPYDGRVARGIVEVLASDSLEGRKSGQPGGERAERYAAELFRSWGLVPGGDQGTYFQRYPFQSFQVTGPPELTWLGAPPGNLTYTYGSDYVVLLYSGAADLRSEVVYVGYGITDVRSGRDDFAGLDVQGRIVLALRGAPSTGGPWTEERSMGYKAANARAHGASALLLFEGDNALLGTIQEKYFDPGFPALFLSARVARDLLVAPGRSFDALKTAAAGSTPPGFATGRTVHLAVQGLALQPAQARNVIARIPGRVPALAGECVVVGAHLDHLGRDGLGRVYPGADDNGSGAATVLTMAKWLSESGWRPARTVYFVLFTCEEQGLQGSMWFSGHPPAESIGVMLNMDMVGVGRPVPNLGGVDRYPDLVRMARSLLPDSVRSQVSLFATDGNSDHFPFSDRGIPSCFTISSGEHPSYHQLEDKAWRIDASVLEGIGRFEVQLLQRVADTTASWLDARRGARLWSRLGRPLARASWGEDLAALKRSTDAGAQVVLLTLPEASALTHAARVERLEKWCSAPDSHFRIATSAGDVDRNCGQGNVSVVLEARVSSFELPDSTFLHFLRKYGVRWLAPTGAPSASAARRAYQLGMLLDACDHGSPAALDVPCLYRGAVPAGARRGFALTSVPPRTGDRASGWLMEGSPVELCARLAREGWQRAQVLEWLGGNFASFWEGALP